MLNLDFTYCTAVNYAMLQNHVPVVRKLALENTGEEPIENVTVVVTLLTDIAILSTSILELIPANSTITVADVVLKLDAKYLAELTEKVSDEIEVKVLANEEVILLHKYPIDILPFDQWAGVNVLPEMLSAFVTPNHPMLAPIIHRASEFLEKWTGSPSLDEYQTRNPDRVKKQMAAIYEAIAEQNIVYCTPPASYEQSGQRVRMCDNILNTKLGTCLDMALLYASCLEAIGVNSIIVVIKGHAFAGGWLIDDTFADTVSDDVSLLTKRLADGINEIAVVETTCMNSGKNITFDLAMSAAEDHLRDDSSFVLSVDVKRCRFASIRPLPQKINDTSGIKIIETAPKLRESETPKAVVQDTTVIDIAKIDVTKQRVWERKLLDLTLRNNLLNIRLTKTTLQLISANINLLEDSLAAGDEFAILPKPMDWSNGLMDAGIYQSINQTDPITGLVEQELTQKRLRSYLTEKELGLSLTNLYRSSRSSMEENGANTLYLALGLLKWFETPSSIRPRYAPILLLPVEIIRKSAAKGYIIRSREEEVMMNITLLEMLRQDFGINIGGLEVLPKDDSGVDVKLVFNTIRKGIMNQKRWNVEEQAILGIFSFSKFIMWNDIHNNADKLCKNKIVKSLISGVVQWDSGDDVELNLDKDFTPADIALPISADSFQMEAVCNADAGSSFILHGPPGTGKSQTITNIIANALYKGKKVLFVAEKMAALSVVQKRLSAIGLAPFCLELHSNKSKKSTVLEQLRVTTEIVKKRSLEDFEAESERLHLLREELGNYVDLLHRKNRVGISIYDAIYGYCNNESIGDEFTFSQDIATILSKAKLTRWRDILEQMQATVNICGSIYNHPLKEIHLPLYSTSAKSEIKALLVNQIRLLGEFKNDNASIIESLFSGDLERTTFDEYRELNDILNAIILCQHISSTLLVDRDLKNVVTQVNETVTRGIERDKLKTELLATFSKSLLEIDAEKLLLEWQHSENSWFLPKFIKQNKICKVLKGCSLSGKIEKNDTKSILEEVLKFQEENHYILSKTDIYSDKFGLLWGQWEAMRDCCDNSVNLSNMLISMAGDISKGEQLRSIIAGKLTNGIDAFISVYGSKIDKFISSFTDLQQINEELENKYSIATSFEECWINNNLEQSDRIVDNIEMLKDWSTWNNIKDIATSEGLGSYVTYISEAENINIVATFNKALYKYIIDSTIDAEPTLANFNGKLFEDKIRKFKELTLNFEKLTRDELYAKLSANIPSFIKEASQSSEVGILQRNIRNRGRGTSLRKLFDTIPALISRISPCMLMSPMSVAQYLDADNMHFDLIIFDEASQMPTCEAVGAIARGDSLIVVGDPKQMPPTSFFASNSIDEDNLDKEDLESILDDCLALSMPSKHLLWHYRSKHESLIAFSNSQYYENKLLTFPSPDDIKSKVTYQSIDGFYDKGRSRQNRAEAEAIVNEVISRLENPELSNRSIGIVTFSSTQQILIEDLLNDAFVTNPTLEEKAQNCSEPLFVKNLENVQGDERDIILFSVGYGPDKDGKVSLNFGPLNRDGGWRRLNVAVSRARYEMKVFSTLRSDQIDLARTSSEGVAGLKAFLEYAEKGKNSFSISSSSTFLKNDSLINIIAEKIKEQGYEVNANVGCSGYRVDIGVIDPSNRSEYILGVVCDGENYKSAKSCRDREIIQNDVLRLLGWSVHRIWSMDWIENPNRVINGIIDAIKLALTKEKAIEEPVIEIKADIKLAEIETISNQEEIIESEKSLYQIEYSTSPIILCGVYPEEFTYGNWNSLISKQINDVIDCEAPISREQLCRRVLSMWNISRIGSRIDVHFSMIFKQMNLKITGNGKELFFWKENQDPSEYMNYRVGYSVASDIAPEEVSVAVKEILENQVSLSREDLIREVAHIFGYTRLGTIVVASVQRGIDKAIERSFAREEDGRVGIV